MPWLDDEGGFGEEMLKTRGESYKGKACKVADAMIDQGVV